MKFAPLDTFSRLSRYPGVSRETGARCSDRAVSPNELSLWSSAGEGPNILMATSRACAAAYFISRLS